MTIEIEDDAPIAPEGPSVPIRYEDAHLVVIVKPAGVLTHPTAGRRSGTLVNRLLGMGVPLAPAERLARGVPPALEPLRAEGPVRAIAAGNLSHQEPCLDRCMV